MHAKACFFRRLVRFLDKTFAQQVRYFVYIKQTCCFQILNRKYVDPERVPDPSQIQTTKIPGLSRHSPPPPSPLPNIYDKSYEAASVPVMGSSAVVLYKRITAVLSIGTVSCFRTKSATIKSVLRRDPNLTHGHMDLFWCFLTVYSRLWGTYFRSIKPSQACITVVFLFRSFLYSFRLGFQLLSSVTCKSSLYDLEQLYILCENHWYCPACFYLSEKLGPFRCWKVQNSCITKLPVEVSVIY